MCLGARDDPTDAGTGPLDSAGPDPAAPDARIPEAAPPGPDADLRCNGHLVVDTLDGVGGR